MQIRLHKESTGTLKVRAAIRASTEPACQVSQRYVISEQTVWTRRKRDSVADRLHKLHRLQITLASKTLLQAMKTWDTLNPNLFKKQPYYLPGCDAYVNNH